MWGIGTEKTASGHLPILCHAIIRIGGSCSTAGFSVWWHIGVGLIASTETVRRHYWSVRRGIVNLPIVALFLPPELRFGYTDSLDFKSKQDAERYLGRFLLVNLDEFDQISSNQQGFLKHLCRNLWQICGNPTVLPFRRCAVMLPFIGTSNQMELLTDPSGSRRFICIEVTAPIDTNVTINYKQLYAQAMDAIYKGERYWLNDEDEAILKETNRDF